MSGGHGPHADANDPFQRQVAVVLAMYSVGLAFVNMLTNQSRTKSILRSNEATDQWAFYQSKSTKEVVISSELDMLKSLPTPPTETIGRLSSEIGRYDGNKKEIKQKAESLVAEAKAAEHKEHYFEYASVLIELAIVIAGVSLLLHKRSVFYMTVVLALAGLALTGYTALVMTGHHDHTAESSEHAPSEHAPSGH